MLKTIQADGLSVAQQRHVVKALGEDQLIPADATIVTWGRLALYQVYSDVNGPAADAHIKRWGTLPRRWRLRWVRSSLTWAAT